MPRTFLVRKKNACREDRNEVDLEGASIDESDDIVVNALVNDTSGDVEHRTRRTEELVSGGIKDKKFLEAHRTPTCASDPLVGDDAEFRCKSSVPSPALTSVTSAFEYWEHVKLHLQQQRRHQAFPQTPNFPYSFDEYYRRYFETDLNARSLFHTSRPGIRANNDADFYIPVCRDYGPLSVGTGIWSHDTAISNTLRDNKIECPLTKGHVHAPKAVHVQPGNYYFHPYLGLPEVAFPKRRIHSVDSDLSPTSPLTPAPPSPGTPAGGQYRTSPASMVGLPGNIEIINGGYGIKNPLLTPKYNTSPLKNTPAVDTKFSCKICAKSFEFPKLLQRHLKTHADVKRYLCVFCGKGFNDTFDLKRHTRTHTGVRPYKCEFCDKAFTQRCSLESHCRKIHGVEFSFGYKERRGKVYVCEDCGHVTHDPEDYFIHIKDSHPSNPALQRCYDKRQFKFDESELQKSTVKTPC